MGVVNVAPQYGLEPPTSAGVDDASFAASYAKSFPRTIGIHQHNLPQLAA
jgi:hypothetical protein